MIISISSSLWLVLVLFIVTGLGSGSANLAMMGLISHWFQRSLRGRASGLVVCWGTGGRAAAGDLAPRADLFHVRLQFRHLRDVYPHDG
jgi:MFS family permease